MGRKPLKLKDGQAGQKEDSDAIVEVDKDSNKQFKKLTPIHVDPKEAGGPVEQVTCRQIRQGT